MNGELRIGVCGVRRATAGTFARLNVLEVQQTFYWPPQLRTVQRWRAEAPAGFEFTLKAFQAITHSAKSPTYRRAKFTAQQLQECGDFRDTALVRQAWATTRELADGMAATAVVFQCPPSFTATEENVAQFRQFFQWAKRGKLKFAWEPRHASWTDELIAELCRELELIHTVDPLERESVYGTPQYFRLHGQALGNYRYRYNHGYSEDELRKLLDKCVGKPTYCLFNNFVHMTKDAERFASLAEGGGSR